MERADNSSDLTRFDEISDKAALDHRASVSLAVGQRGRTLAPDPAMPQGLRGRAADNWRVLLSIADAYGEGWGERARLAALIMARGYRDEDIVVTLLRHIREIFEAPLRRSHRQRRAGRGLARSRRRPVDRMARRQG